MKKILSITLLSVTLSFSALATVYPFNTAFQNAGVIPDGSLTGLADTRAISGLTSPITSVTVILNISGGYNGDLLAYLSHDGVMIPLLNNVGAPENSSFGYSNPGFSVTLSDSALASIHDYQTGDINLTGTVTGNWTPDGGQLSDLNGLSGNGNWTLFFADTVSSGSPSTLTSWSLDIITAVPEPINVALGVFGGLFLVGSVCRSERVRKLFGKAAAVPAE